MMAYKCDRCGKIFDWYEEVYEDPKLNCSNDFRLVEEYREKKGYAKCFSANALKFMFYNPANENCSTNHGVISAEIDECGEGNNNLVMLCRDCMKEFMDSLQNFWDEI